ncbi:hypothetical protein M9H77_14261 [Catharanthus roseus]|uniref:Uncharacterized protein n=1 Tax=Catharanthus roseus TaxID=4058 RepID=A0ACC0BMH8_CATRO|nr:hypothetical protein M9H77_14261 [Catharanthus roseus]
MKKERSSHSKIKTLKTLKTYVLVRDMLRDHPIFVGCVRIFLFQKSVVLFQKRAHPIFLYKEIGRPFLETGILIFFHKQIGGNGMEWMIQRSGTNDSI